MKFIKWLLIGLVTLVLVVGLGIAALVYLVDWNNYRETIQQVVKKQTGRDLVIAGDLKPTIFPWAGISTGAVQLANAEGFGEQPFASIEGADVKVKLMPLLKREVNVSKIQLNGLSLDLQRAADGSTNWDDLIKSTTTTTTTDAEVTKEVEGSSATIAALAVGGIEVKQARVSWQDKEAGTDVLLNDFNLDTGAIELEKPFNVSFDADVDSSSMAIAAALAGSGEVMLDLDDQVYSVKGFTLDTTAKGDAMPGGSLESSLGGNIEARMAEQRIEVADLALAALGIELGGNLNVSNLDTTPTITGALSSNEFSPRTVLEKLGSAAPETANADALKKAQLAVKLTATPEAASLDDIKITFDQSTVQGSASLPSLAGAMPPLRFDLALDRINVDDYLPPATEGESEGAGQGGSEGGSEDAPIELPTELLRQLDVDGTFRVGELIASGLTTRDITIPVKATGGKVGVENMQASLYSGALNTSANVNVTGNTPSYTLGLDLNGIQSEPLLSDLLDKASFLAGGGNLSATITTRGNSVAALKAALDGDFNGAFTDGAIKGINLGYQIRRAQAAFTGQSMASQAKEVQTDFSSLRFSGTIADGVIDSNDFDLRSPLLRLAGAGNATLPGEAVDYSLTTLITGTAEGQGGADLAALKGVEIKLPIKASFAELSENFAGVLIRGLTSNITGNLTNQAKALAEQQAEALKQQAKEKADALKEQAQEQLQQQQDNIEQRAAEQLDRALGDDAKDKLKGLLGR